LYAASNQLTDTVLALLESGADVGASDNMGHKDIVRMLVDAKADIGRRDNFGRTPWMTALQFNKDAGLRTLLEPDHQKERYLRELQRDKHAGDVAKHMLAIYR
jgi:ankyrin repeat protein